MPCFLPSYPKFLHISFVTIFYHSVYVIIRHWSRDWEAMAEHQFSFDREAFLSFLKSLKHVPLFPRTFFIFIAVKTAIGEYLNDLATFRIEFINHSFCIVKTVCNSVKFPCTYFFLYNSHKKSNFVLRTYSYLQRTRYFINYLFIFKVVNFYSFRSVSIFDFIKT